MSEPKYDLYKVTYFVTRTAIVRATNETNALEVASQVDESEMVEDDRQEKAHVIPCDHDPMDLRNKVIVSGKACRKCGMIYP